MTRRIYIDPSYKSYYENRLFDTNDSILNRDGTLEPFFRLRLAAGVRGIKVNTADYLFNALTNAYGDYYSFGLLDNYLELAKSPNVRLRGFVIMEPPVVAPKLYRALPDLTKHFEYVYLHNTIGDGYSLKNVDRSRLRSFYWPQPLYDVKSSYWVNEDRVNRIVVINGNHIPRSFSQQLYGKRIEVIARLAKLGVVDLFGRGWDQWWSHRSMWPPYWRNYKTLMSVYRGTCESKYEVLSRYRFSLCFENMAMNGYVTEKLFDCLYAGTIPLYLGASNIEQLVPSKAYIDCRYFDTWEEMAKHVMAMSDIEIERMRLAGRDFIRSDAGKQYYDSLIHLML